MCHLVHAAWNSRLSGPNLDSEQRRRQFVSPLVTAFVFLLSIDIAFFFPDLAKISWFLILPVSLNAKRDK